MVGFGHFAVTAHMQVPHHSQTEDGRSTAVICVRFNVACAKEKKHAAVPDSMLLECYSPAIFDWSQ